VEFFRPQFRHRGLWEWLAVTVGGAGGDGVAFWERVGGRRELDGGGGVE
jgi:hypothetical protein